MLSGSLAWAGGPAVYQAPVLLDHAGVTTSLRAEASGDRLLVVIMKGTWCPVCVEQIQRFEQSAQITQLGTRVVGLTTDGLQAIEVLQPSLNSRLLADDNTRTVVSGLGLWRSDWGHPLPAILLFDRCGQERARWLGRSPSLAPDGNVLTALEGLAAEPEDCSADDGLSTQRGPTAQPGAVGRALPRSAWISPTAQLGRSWGSH